MTRGQAQRLARLLWGPRGNGAVYRLVDRPPGNWWVIGEWRGADICGAMQVSEGGVVISYNTAWNEWDGDNGDIYCHLPDAETIRHEEGEDEDEE